MGRVPTIVGDAGGISPRGTLGGTWRCEPLGAGSGWQQRRKVSRLTDRRWSRGRPLCRGPAGGPGDQRPALLRRCTEWAS